MNKRAISWPKVSILTVVYNSEKYIEETIKSVIEQGYPNLDYVIIDGGSSDGTLDIVNSYSKHISTIVSEKDNGIYNAMNKGKKLCKGDWVCFLNSGDVFFNKDVLKTTFSIVSKLKPDFVYGDTSYYSLIDKFEYQEGKLVYENDFIFKFPICHQSMFFSNNVLNKLNWYDEYFNVVADWDITIKIFEDPKFSKLYINTCISKFLIDEVNWKNGIGGLWEWVLISYRYRSNFIIFLSFLIFVIKSIRYVIVINSRHLKIYRLYKRWKVRRILKSFKGKQLNA